MSGGLELVDSSVWIDFYRGDPQAVRRVRPLLDEDRARTCGPVYAEILSGARNKATLEDIKWQFRGIAWVMAHEPVWERTAETRFALARFGRSCAIVDVMIALAAADSGVRLLARDRDFRRIVGVLPLDLEVF